MNGEAKRGKIVILAAMGIEINPIKKVFKLSRSGGIFYGGDIILIETGIGRKRVARQLELLLEKKDLIAVISAGTAGAVSKELETGDIVIPQHIKKIDGERQFSVSSVLLEKTGQIKSNARLKIGGSAYTVDTVFDAADKETLLKRDPAAAFVDMESFHIADFFDRHGIPFIVMRSISDKWDFEMPRSLMMGGAITKKKIYKLDIVKILRLWYNVAYAARNNAKAIKSYVDVILRYNDIPTYSKTKHS